VAWKRAKEGRTVPADSVVRAPISSLTRLGDKSDRVIGMVRAWRAYSAIEAKSARGGAPPPEVRWWFQNYAMLRKLAIRGSRFLLVGYERLLFQPEKSTRRILAFVGRDSPEDFARVSLLPPVPISRRQYTSGVLEKEEVRAFDLLNSLVDREQPLARSDLELFNDVNKRLRSRFPSPGPGKPAG
jgi:hypothetical protein